MKLALVNRRVVVLVQKVNRVFDSDDVVELRLVDQIDDRRQRGTLAATGRPGHQHDPGFQFADLTQLGWQVEIFKPRRPRRDDAHDDRMRAALLENVDPKAAQAGNTEREIGRADLLQTLRCFFVPADDELGDAGSLRRRVFVYARDWHRLQLANQFNLRRAPRRKDQIAYLVRRGQHLLQDLRQIQRGGRS